MDNPSEVHTPKDFEIMRKFTYHNAYHLEGKLRKRE